jgi:hypothetical protein
MVLHEQAGMGTFEEVPGSAEAGFHLFMASCGCSAMIPDTAAPDGPSIQPSVEHAEWFGADPELVAKMRGWIEEPAIPANAGRWQTRRAIRRWWRRRPS